MKKFCEWLKIKEETTQIEAYTPQHEKELINQGLYGDSGIGSTLGLDNIKKERKRLLEQLIGIYKSLYHTLLSGRLIRGEKEDQSDSEYIPGSGGTALTKVRGGSQFLHGEIEDYHKKLIAKGLISEEERQALKNLLNQFEEILTPMTKEFL